MYGRVTRYFQDRGYGFILGEDKETYFIHCSNLCGEHIARGYQVDFKPFRNERSDYNARDVIVIDTPENGAGEGRSNRSNNKRGKHRNHKPCNADRLSRDDREFKRFVKGFFQEQKEMEEGGSAVDGQDGITVGLFIETLKDYLSEDERVMFTGFGRFEMRTVKEKKGRNLHTGETCIIPEHEYVGFRASDLLYDSIRDGGDDIYETGE